MKARVKATGDIVDVHRLCMSSQGDIWQKKSGREYFAHELDFDVKEPPKPRYNPDYWTRLEHQAAISIYCAYIERHNWVWSYEDIIFKAHTLVEKLKEK